MKLIKYLSVWLSVCLSFALCEAQTVSMYPNKINDAQPVNTSRQQWTDVAATTGTATFDFYFNVSKFRADRAAASLYGGAYTVIVIVDTVAGGSGVATGPAFPPSAGLDRPGTSALYLAFHRPAAGPAP